MVVDKNIKETKKLGMFFAFSFFAFFFVFSVDASSLSRDAECASPQWQERDDASPVGEQDGYCLVCIEDLFLPDLTVDKAVRSQFPLLAEEVVTEWKAEIARTLESERAEEICRKKYAYPGDLLVVKDTFTNSWQRWRAGIARVKESPQFKRNQLYRLGVLNSGAQLFSCFMDLRLSLERSNCYIRCQNFIARESLDSLRKQIAFNLIGYAIFPYDDCKDKPVDISENELALCLGIYIVSQKVQKIIDSNHAFQVMYHEDFRKGLNHLQAIVDDQTACMHVRRIACRLLTGEIGRFRSKILKTLAAQPVSFFEQMGNSQMLRDIQSMKVFGDALVHALAIITTEAKSRNVSGDNPWFVIDQTGEYKYAPWICQIYEELYADYSAIEQNGPLTFMYGDEKFYAPATLYGECLNVKAVKAKEALSKAAKPIDMPVEEDLEALLLSIEGSSSPSKLECSSSPLKSESPSFATHKKKKKKKSPSPLPSEGSPRSFKALGPSADQDLPVVLEQRLPKMLFHPRISAWFCYEDKKNLLSCYGFSRGRYFGRDRDPVRARIFQEFLQKNNYDRVAAAKEIIENHAFPKTVTALIIQEGDESVRLDDSSCFETFVFKKEKNRTRYFAGEVSCSGTIQGKALTVFHQLLREVNPIHVLNNRPGVMGGAEEGFTEEYGGSAERESFELVGEQEGWMHQACGNWIHIQNVEQKDVMYGVFKKVL